jgi:hypothetical protein
MSRTVIIGPTGSRLRTVNLATGPSGATGTWATAHYAGSGPTGLFETVQVASVRDNRFKSIAIPGFTGTVTPDAGGGGGGGGAYTAKAVHFDGATKLTNASLSAIDNSFFSQVVWVKFSGTFSAGQNTGNFYITDAEGNFTDETYLVDDGSFTSFLDNAAASAGFTVNSAASSIPVGAWVCVITSSDVNHAAGQKKAKIYLGDTDITSSVTDNKPAFTLGYNGKSMNIGTDTGNFLIADIADLRIMPGISLLDGSGDIPLATRRLFIDANGKPVDPATATAQLGAPAVLFSGDSTSFATNQGTGGAFTVSAGTLTNASTHP